ncbi:hypothetical protein GUJ93_ZPchr0001g29414 [Zizania palustris]|uniref:Uncharacterized protein n=1 Tax=Zizania palustris TaxID=103762 RepID=A0A8J5VTQ0_ZIZPA|nr:hypothetical protein GUJ93_ZPchr0001g29414 [Zizania palustris]
MAAAGDGEDAKPTQQQQQRQPAAAGAAETAEVPYGGGVIAMLEEQWRKTKEHAETYPYVWGSYILVYGGLAAYLTWRWRKLRRTEDRVRVLQGRLRQLASAEESQVVSTPPPLQQQQPPPAGPGKPTASP